MGGKGVAKESRTFYTASGQVSSLTENKLRRMALTVLRGKHPRRAFFDVARKESTRKSGTRRQETVTRARVKMA